MLEYLIWILLGLFCLNRLLFWVAVFLRKWKKWYGTVAVTTTSVILICLPLAPQPRLDSFSLLWRILGVIVFVIGMLIMLQADREFHKMKTRPDGLPTTLVTTGPYSIVRHPQYVGLNISFGGWALIWVAIYSLYLIPVIIFLNGVQAFLEEKHILEKRFGEEYREYKQKVGMYLPKTMKRT
ncbi:MAG: methyltransferase family protein [Candidatus Hodarchaeota archaeon]